METGTTLSPLAVGSNHLALIAGLPASLTYLAADFCRDLLGRQNNGCELVVINELNLETLDRIAAATGPVVFLSEVPDAAVVTLVRGTEFPVLVLDQSFSAATHSFMAARGTAVLDTVRTMVRGQIGLDDLADLPRTHLLRVQSAEHAYALAERIADLLKIEPRHVAAMGRDRNLYRPLAEILDETFTYGPVPSDAEADKWLDDLSTFYGFHPDAPPAMLNVPVAMLLEAAAPHLPATNAIDLVGPARCLTFGPYIHLPRGQWKARFEFLSKGNVSTNTLGFDIVCDREIKVDRQFDLQNSGRFAFDCEFEVHNPYVPLEFRTFLHRGSIDGQFTPVALTIMRFEDEAGSPSKPLAFQSA